MVKIQEIKDQSTEELKFRISEIEKELFELTNELKVNHKLEKPHLLKSLKKEKAQILTILTEKARKA